MRRASCEISVCVLLVLEATAAPISANESDLIEELRYQIQAYRYEDMLSTGKKLYEIRRRKFGDEHPKTLNIRHHVGFAALKSGQIKEAYDWLSPGLLDAVRVRGPSHFQTLQFIVSLAECFHLRENRAMSIHCAWLAVQQQQVLFNTHQDPTFDGDTYVFKVVGREAPRAQLQELSFKLAGPVLANVISDTASESLYGGRKQARQYVERPLTQYGGLTEPLRKALDYCFPDETRNAAASRRIIYLADVARLVAELRDFDLSDQLLDTAVRQAEQRPTEKLVKAEVVRSQADVAGLRLRFQHARQLIERATAIARSSPNFSEIHEIPLEWSRTQLEWRQGNQESAISKLRELAETCEKLLTSRHPRTADVYHQLGIWLEDKNELRGAIDAYDQALQMRKTQDRDLFLPIEGFAAIDPRASGAIGVAVRDGASEVAKVAAEWIINTKALMQEQRHRARNQNDHTLLHRTAPQGSPEWNRAMRRSYTDMIIRKMKYRLYPDLFLRPWHLNRTVSGDELKQWLEMRDQIEDKSRDQRPVDAVADSYLNTPWTTSDSVRAHLPPKTVLVDFVRYSSRDTSNARPDVPHRSYRYAAWILPSDPNLSVTVVDLGAEADIQPLLKDLRRHLETASTSIRQISTLEFRDQYMGKARMLAETILLPVLEQVPASFNRLILCPDHGLWFVPWEALPLSDGRFAVEKYQMDYVIAARHLLAVASDKVPTSPPAIFAHPDFGATKAMIMRDSWDPELVRESNHTKASLAFTAAYNFVKRGQIVGLPPAPELPGTEAEARSIAESFTDTNSPKPRVFLRAKASELSFACLRRPRILVLSTHAFFADPNKLEINQPIDTPPYGRGNFKSIRVPMARVSSARPAFSGLLLAGYNQLNQNAIPKKSTWREAAESAINSGMITDFDILRSDFEGTELVVLSACDTALGLVQNSGEVTNLRSAFHTAGAQTVVATLWNVPDLETARLMKAFFEHMAGGMPKHRALRQAKLDRISVRRQRYGAAHPFNWAAFTMTVVGDALKPTTSGGAN